MPPQINTITAPLSNKKIVYSLDGERKTITESQAVNMLGRMGKRDLQQALPYYLNFTNENPHAEQLLRQFYETLASVFMFEELLELTNARLKKIPSCSISFSWKLEALESMGRNKNALTLRKAVVLNNPNNSRTLNDLGVLYNKLGEYDEANNCFSKAIEIDPSFTVAHWNLSEHGPDINSQLTTIKKLISNDLVPEKDTHYLHFAAYRCYEKLGELENAFEHLQIANALKRRTLSYSVRTELKLNDDIQSIFSSKFIKNLTPAIKSDIQPIFIIGMPGSDNTLLEELIANHTTVAKGRAMTALASSVLRAQSQSNTEESTKLWFDSRSEQDWQQIGRLYEHNTRFARGNKQVFIDNSEGNYRLIGLIKASLANAKIIVVDRNPMGAAFSSYRQIFDDQEAQFSYQFDELAQIHASYTALIKHWESVTDGLIMRIKYEDLVHNQTSIVDRILNFCSLDPQAGNLKPNINQSINDWPQYEQSMQTMRRELEKVNLPTT